MEKQAIDFLKSVSTQLTLQQISYMFGVCECIVFDIVRRLSDIISFKNLKDFPSVFGAISGSHITALSTIAGFKTFSTLYHKTNNDPANVFSRITHILGDSEYALHKWLLTPYKDTENLSRDQRKYNYVQSLCIGFDLCWVNPKTTIVITYTLNDAKSNV
ncbi:hypothetical protein KUTeg_012617 [Tegillarca granosa]|uniref:Uncharacterized protein n=1 Tax=Tegillarca granosa TaxID=220873 RepID=A0ABQ9F4D6_TEGGR|nr:hypothetical protein KUTeg_012617 [Tegillarca granosa]